MLKLVKKLKARNLLQGFELEEVTFEHDAKSVFDNTSLKESKIKRMEDLQILLSGASKLDQSDEKRHLAGRGEKGGIQSANIHLQESSFNVETL